LGRKIARHEGFDQGEEKRTEESPRQTAQASEDRRDEGLERDAAHLRVDLVFHAIEDTRHAREGASDREDEDDDETWIDAHEG
jgi:hypothetical protein